MIQQYKKSELTIRKTRAKPKFRICPKIIRWLTSTYQVGKNKEYSVPKMEIFNEYVRICNLNNIIPKAMNVFGKLLRIIFPNIIPRRLGNKNAMIGHYSGIKKKSIESKNGYSYEPKKDSRYEPKKDSRYEFKNGYRYELKKDYQYESENDSSYESENDSSSDSLTESSIGSLTESSIGSLTESSIDSLTESIIGSSENTFYKIINIINDSYSQQVYDMCNIVYYNNDKTPTQPPDSSNNPTWCISSDDTVILPDNSMLCTYLDEVISEGFTLCTYFDDILALSESSSSLDDDHAQLENIEFCPTWEVSATFENNSMIDSQNYLSGNPIDLECMDDIFETAVPLFERI